MKIPCLGKDYVPRNVTLTVGVCPRSVAVTVDDQTVYVGQSLAVATRVRDRWIAKMNLQPLRPVSDALIRASRVPLIA